MQNRLIRKSLPIIAENNKPSITNNLKNGILAILGTKNTGIGLMASSVDTGISLGQEKNDTYNVDGITIKENDSYVQIQTKTNQGLDVATIKAYVRDDEIIKFEQFGPYSTYSIPSYENKIRRNWKDKGYK